jgi:hypothetical protein
VTEELLDNPQVRATVKHVGGEAVAQGMRVGGHRGPAIDHPSHVSWAQARSRAVEEDSIRRTSRSSHDPPAVSQPSLERICAQIVHRNPSFTPPLAPNRDGATPKVQVALVETAKLGDSQAAAVEQLQNRVVAQRHSSLETLGAGSHHGTRCPHGRVEQDGELTPIEDPR